MLFIIKAHRYKCINGQVDKLDKIQMGHDAEKTLMKELNAKKAPTGDMLDMISGSHGVKMTVYHSNVSPKYRKIIMNKNSAIKSLNSCKKKGLKAKQVLAVAEEDGTFSFFTHDNFESIHWSKMKPWKPVKTPKLPKPKPVPVKPKPKPVPPKPKPKPVPPEPKPKPVPVKPKTVPKKIKNVEKPEEFVAPAKRESLWKNAKSVEAAKKQLKEQFDIGDINMNGFSEKTGLEALNRHGASWSAIKEKYPKINNYLRHRKLDINFEYNEKWGAHALNSYFPEQKDYFGHVKSKPTMNLSAFVDKAKFPKTLDFGEFVGTCGNSTEYIARHELGHHLDFMLLNEEGGSRMANKFRSLYVNNRQKYFKNISFYSMAHQREGFAEAFAAYTSPLYEASKKKLPKAVEDYFEELLGKAVPAKKPFASKIKGVQFHKAKHQKLYGEFYDRFMADLNLKTVEDFKEKWKSAVSLDIRKATAQWKGDTTLPRAIALKMKAEQLESGIKVKTRVPKTAPKHIVDRTKRLANEMKDKDYLEMRALSQAYFDKNNIKELKLYRGTDGRTGEKIARKVRELKPGDTVTITDDSLVGYSSDYQIADGFGAQEGGVTTRVKFKTSDILIPDELWPVFEGAEEFEYMCIGSKKKISITDITAEAFAWLKGVPKRLI